MSPRHVLYIFVASFVTRQVLAAQCDGLTCDPCPLFQLANGTVASASVNATCVQNSDGTYTLQCNCPDPPANAIPAGRTTATTPPSPSSTTQSSSPSPQGTTTDEFQNLPPNGSGGASLPTQSFGQTSAAAAAAPPFILVRFVICCFIHARISLYSFTRRYQWRVQQRCLLVV